MSNRTQARCRGQLIYVEYKQGSLHIKSPYDPLFVAEIKAAVPYDKRSFSKPHWIVHASYALEVSRIINSVYNVTLQLPDMPADDTSNIEVLMVEYVGWCKLRAATMQSTASGWCNGGWSVIFPEDVLMNFFDAVVTLDETTYYQTLLIKEDATKEEIKKAYRRLANQWHPDKCKEANAVEMFRTITEAYEALSDDTKRKKYDAFLFFERDNHIAQHEAQTYRTQLQSYRSPLRCGMVVAEGQWSIGRFVVSKILAWEDITNEQGKVMSTSWVKELEHFVTEWV